MTEERTLDEATRAAILQHVLRAAAAARDGVSLHIAAAREGMMRDELRALARQLGIALVTYAIRREPDAIECLVCERVSHNAHDLAQRYCGFCYHFHEG